MIMIRIVSIVQRDRLQIDNLAKIAPLSDCVRTWKIHEEIVERPIFLENYNNMLDVASQSSDLGINCGILISV
jgi:hypothetical protein